MCIEFLDGVFSEENMCRLRMAILMTKSML
jgi:hypothetical protein